MSYVGLDGKLYYRSGGTYAAPVWTEIKKAIDVALNTEQTAVDVSSRESRWKAYLAGLKDGELTFGYRVPRGVDAVLTALRGMLQTGEAKLDFAIMDDDITLDGSQGLRFIGLMTSDNLNQGLEEGAMVDFTIKPAYEADGSGDRIEPVLLIVEVP